MTFVFGKRLGICEHELWLPYIVCFISRKYHIYFRGFRIKLFRRRNLWFEKNVPVNVIYNAHV